MIPMLMFGEKVNSNNQVDISWLATWARHLINWPISQLALDADAAADCLWHTFLIFRPLFPNQAATRC